MKRIAFFDFDGTITYRDSLFIFLKYMVGVRKFYEGLLILSPVLIGYLLKTIPNDIAKQKVFGFFFRDYDLHMFKVKASEFSKNELDKIVREKALEKIAWHKNRGDEVVIVTASMECWMKDWCKTNGLRLIGTKLESKNGRITGNFESKNCYGLEKIRRIKEVIELSEYSHVCSYGDSTGDKHLKSISNEYFHKPFH